jgi:hypothetical protein
MRAEWAEIRLTWDILIKNNAFPRIALWLFSGWQILGIIRSIWRDHGRGVVRETIPAFLDY